VADPSANEFRSISLCAGYGGLDLALDLAVRNARTVCFVEREAVCVGVLAAGRSNLQETNMKQTRIPIETNPPQLQLKQVLRQAILSYPGGRRIATKKIPLWDGSVYNAIDPSRAGPSYYVFATCLNFLGYRTRIAFHRDPSLPLPRKRRQCRNRKPKSPTPPADSTASC